MTENDLPKAACEVGGEECAALTPTPAALGRGCLGGEAMLGSGVGALPGPQLLSVCRKPAWAWGLRVQGQPSRLCEQSPSCFREWGGPPQREAQSRLTGQTLGGAGQAESPAGCSPSAAPSWLWTLGGRAWIRAQTVLPRPGEFRQASVTRTHVLAPGSLGSATLSAPAEGWASGWLRGLLLVPLAAQWVTRHSIRAPAPGGADSRQQVLVLPPASPGKASPGPG